MRAKLLIARGVLALGVATLLATSRPGSWRGWSDGASQRVLIESDGAGDDQLIRFRLTLTEGLARDLSGVELSIRGTVSRPGSDLGVLWQDPEHADEEGSSPGTTSLGGDDFTQLTGNHWLILGCDGKDPCELGFEARVSAAASAAYSMEATVAAEISGHDPERPTGDFELNVEVLDAP